MKVLRYSDLDESALDRLCRRNDPGDPSILETCREAFQAVRESGDGAVLDWTARWDGVRLASLKVGADEMEQAHVRVSAEEMAALKRAAANIRRFHEGQLQHEAPIEVEPGMVCWREWRPISPLGLYVPGGSAVLPSTVLMLGVPARMVGCERVVLCVPPGRNGGVVPEVLVAAGLAGIGEVYKVGGAQAVAAMTLGTESIPRVEKIVGPGNRWVQTAKLLATFHGVAIDMVAGPSEVLVIADESADSAQVAADLIAQAEHGSDSQAVLIATSEIFIQNVLEEIRHQTSDLPRRTPAEGALSRSFALQVDSEEQALEFSNRYAPEHLLIQTRDPRALARRVQSAGSVFLGTWTPEVAGDYASGTNHTLPTSGLARSFSGVSLETFVKKITFQELTRSGLESLAPTLETLARLEGLEGHRRAVAIRFSQASFKAT